LRRILPAVGKDALVPVFRVLFNLVWALGLWSYHQAHWSDPGAVPARWRQFVRNVGEAMPIAPARPEWQPAKATLCKKCQAPRPERAHHCVLCGMCVMRMDHHCPWINNCVGFHNHKFFLLLGIYTWLASLVALGTSLPEMWRLAGVAVGVEDEDLPMGQGVLEMWDIYAFLLFGLFAFLIALLLTSLLSTHVPLALRNLTTIEDFYENMPNPFEQGSKTGNLAQVFGQPGIDWLIPVKPWKPLSDGITYPPPGFNNQNGGDPSRDFEALTLVEGGVCTEEQAYASCFAFLHDEGSDVDRAWRIRYKVRSPEELKAMKDDKLSPFMAQFWACGRGNANRTAARLHA